MPRTLTQLTLFVSSTSETSAEISALRKVIEGLSAQLAKSHAITLRMVSWPDDVRPGVSTDPQAEISRQMAGYDIYLGLLGTRFGTPTSRSESGTQEEFEAALAHFKDSDRYNFVNFIAVAVCNSIPHETHRGPVRLRPSLPWSR